MGIFNFNMNEEVPETKYEDLPDGVYDVVVDFAEIKKTKKTNEDYLGITTQITSLNYQGRKLFINLLLNHSSDTTRNIAKKLYKQLILACGFSEEPNSLDEFVNKYLVVTIKKNFVSKIEAHELEKFDADVEIAF